MQTETTESYQTRPSWEDLQRVADMAARQTLLESFDKYVGHEMFRVPNNIVGRCVRWILIRYLNKKVYKFRALGRTPVVRGGRKGRASLPLPEAKFIAIYVDVKRGHER